MADNSKKIGIIIHSQTGNTLSVALRLKDELTERGHNVDLERVAAVDDGQTDTSKIVLKGVPDINSYDVLILGAPVRGFSLSPVMSAYLSQCKSLKGKKVLCFVTQFFPYPLLGGNRAIEQMKQICERQGAKINGTGIVNWTGRHREGRIIKVVDNLKACCSELTLL